MDERASVRKPWTAHLMMAVSIVVALFLVPLSFVLSGPFAKWLESAGVHAAPNLADGRQVAELVGFERSLPQALLAGEGDAREIQKALAIRRFSVKKVAFRPGSGMGIAPRLNLSFEFDGELPDPHNSAKGFSLTVVHVYIQAPNAHARPVSSTRVASVDFAGPEWSYQVIIDGFHDQARIFDTDGKLIGRGLGLYVRPERAERSGPADKTPPRVVTTRLTAALPLDLVGDPERGTWAYYVLVGVADSTSPSMMRHSAPAGGLELFAGALAGDWTPGAAARPRLRPLIVKNPA
jgi:hypothetical protein